MRLVQTVFTRADVLVQKRFTKLFFPVTFFRQEHLPIFFVTF